MTAIHKNMGPTKILVKDLNPCITCPLCRGYFVDATALVDCLHVFCRACILRYFDNFKLACPTCNMVYKKKSNPCFRSDSAIQSLVYKVVPGLYSKEVQRREDFYRSTGVRAGSSCSEDSVLGDLSDEHEEWVLSTSDQNQYFSPDEVISLSLEYYKPYLDTTNNSTETKSTNFCDLQTLDKLSDSVTDKTQNCDVNSVGDEKINDSANKERIESGDDFCDNRRDADRRYLRCPAAVTMSHLQKFLRMKYALSIEHRVDIIYLGEVLAAHFSLMDVAYTFKWKRIKPMRFFFRIFTPAKIQPIKIINTSSMGGKQLQVVLSKNNAFPQNIPIAETKLDTIKDDSIVTEITDDQNYRNKERLMANLQLQSKSKVLEKAAEQNGKSYKIERLKSVKVGESREEGTTCIYEYEEPDKDEIRAFAEKRDREWALQKQLDEEKEKHRNGKKRKKSKHSKGNLLYKKRKLHAEITSNDSLQKEESLKLKVKIMPHNGYKHKHHKSSQNHSFEASPKAEMSSKEKLLQMRQVRHKHISSEEKTKSSSHNNNSNHGDDKSDDDKSESITQVPKPTESVEPLKVTLKTTVDNIVNPVPKESTPPVKILSKDSIVNKCPTVQLERHEQVERQAQKTFLKTFQSYTEKYSHARDNNISNSKTRLTYPARAGNLATTRALEQKIQSLHQHCTTVEAKPVSKLSLKLNKKHATAEKPNLYSSSGFTVSKVEVGVKRKLEESQNLQEKFPSLEITLINPPSADKPNLPPNVVKVTPATISKAVPSVVPKTVPSVPVGGTKLEPIVRLIPSPTARTTSVPTVVRPASSPTVRTTASPTVRTTPTTTVPKTNPPPIIGKPNLTTDVKHVAKRPPPATIPLEKIKKSMNRVSSGVSIIPKPTDKCDNSGALDLTKPNKNTETVKPPENQVPNGGTFAKLPEKPMTTAERNIHLSNLQMLSKVATEHPNINKTSPPVNGPSNGNKKPQMPSLQTLKVPSLQTLNQKSNLAKLPKLTEISKTQFRLPNPQLKNMRPNQNQSIRNIPNPSLLLMRQQNQNRLNSTPSNSNESNEIPKVPTSDASSLDKNDSVVEKKQ